MKSFMNVDPFVTPKLSRNQRFCTIETEISPGDDNAGGLRYSNKLRYEASLVEPRQNLFVSGELRQKSFNDQHPKPLLYHRPHSTKSKPRSSKSRNQINTLIDFPRTDLTQSEQYYPKLKSSKSKNINNQQDPNKKTLSSKHKAHTNRKRSESKDPDLQYVRYETIKYDRGEQSKKRSFSEKARPNSNNKNKSNTKKKLSLKKQEYKKIRSPENIYLRSKQFGEAELKPVTKQNNASTMMTIFSEFESYEPSSLVIPGFRAIKKRASTSTSHWWLAYCNDDKHVYAVKETWSRKESAFYSLFYQPKPLKLRKKYFKHPALKYFLKPIRLESTKDTWDSSWVRLFALEDCQYDSLHKKMFCITENREAPKNTNFVQVDYAPAFHIIRNDDSTQSLRQVVLQICKALVFASEQEIVLGSLSPHSIHISMTENPEASLAPDQPPLEVEDVKIVDLSGWHYFKDFEAHIDAVSPYTPPELLNYSLFVSKSKFDRNMLTSLHEYHEVSAIDMWALGITLLQVVLGYPVPCESESLLIGGTPTAPPIFVKGDTTDEILSKQIELGEGIDSILDSWEALKTDLQLHYVIKRMFVTDPNRRITPSEVLSILKSA